jgi:hypothetical protein
MANWNPRKYDGVMYTEAKDELEERVRRAEAVGDLYVALPIDLVREATLELPECDARTVVNGDRFSKTLVEIKCLKRIDPRTNKHDGMHTNRKHVW